MQEKKYDVLIVGELNVDLIMNEIEGNIELGKEVFSREMTLTLGSSSAIFANNLSVLGSRVSFIGRIGKDNFGDIVISSLTKSGVNINDLIISDQNSTGITVAMSYGDERSMVTYPGAMSDLVESDISDNQLKEASHLHVSSIFLQEGLLSGIHLLFQRAKSLGLTTSLDPQWDPHEKWDVNLEELLPNVDFFMPNEKELMLMSDCTSVKEGIMKIKEYSNKIIVKKGINGATLFSKNAHRDMPAFINNNVVDAIGAGDSFNAGFIHAFVEGGELKKCLSMGTAMGAINTTKSGGIAAFDSLDNVRLVAEETFSFKW